MTAELHVEVSAYSVGSKGYVVADPSDRLADPREIRRMKLRRAVHTRGLGSPTGVITGSGPRLLTPATRMSYRSRLGPRLDRRASA